MGKYDKLIAQILQGTGDANVDFEELCTLLTRIGFEMRSRGSHHIFTKIGVDERLNLQRDGSKAKRYQIKQVRAILLRNNLGEKI